MTWLSCVHLFRQNSRQNFNRINNLSCEIKYLCFPSSAQLCCQ